MKRLAFICLATLAACADPVTPPTRVAYDLESFTGVALPAVIFTDYDITVAVISDVITLSSDSSFMEVARFRAASPVDTLINSLAAGLTWGIYTPITIRVTCAS